MHSARPTSGASSTEPWNSMISAWRPSDSKYRLAVLGNLVATRTTSACEMALCTSSAPAFGAARIMRHAPVPEVPELHDVRALLLQHVFADDPDVRRAVLDEDRHVGGPAHDELRVFALVKSLRPFSRNTSTGNPGPPSAARASSKMAPLGTATRSPLTRAPSRPPSRPGSARTRRRFRPGRASTPLGRRIPDPGGLDRDGVVEGCLGGKVIGQVKDRDA